jgi:hypothetical protein
MPIKKNPDLERIQSVWNAFLDSQKDRLKSSLTDLEISALYSCIEDCYEGFQEIYSELIPALQEAYRTKDYDAMQTHVLDIHWAFDHIKNHIVDAQKGFLELSKQLEKQEEEKKKD